MRIGIDIDGVLTDLASFQLDYGTKYCYKKYGKTLINSDKYEMNERFNLTKEEYDEFWKQYIFHYAKNEKPRRFASEVIRRLKNEENDIYIISARTLTEQDNKLGRKMKIVVKKWLAKNHIYYDKLIFTPKGKLQVCLNNNVDIMIEDKAVNVMDISAKVPVLCLDNIYNKECEGKNITRCYSWYDIYSKLNKKEE